MAIKKEAEYGHNHDEKLKDKVKNICNNFIQSSKYFTWIILKFAKDIFIYSVEVNIKL